jgi:hypothetical protein
MRVYISSGTHVGDVAERVDAINDQLEAPEVVFGEGGEASLRGQARALAFLFPRAPLIALAATLQVFMFMPLGGLLGSVLTDGSKGRDLDIMQQIASEYDAEISEIDPVHTAQPVYDRPLLWGMANWLPVVILSGGFTLSEPPLITAVKTGIWLAGIGFVLFYIMLGVVNTQREDAMAATIRRRTGDVDTACVVLGESHHLGVGKRLVDGEDVNVLNPTPADMSWLTRFNLYSWKLIDWIRSR